MNKTGKFITIIITAAVTFGILYSSLGEERFNHFKSHYKHWKHHCEAVEDFK